MKIHTNRSLTSIKLYRKDIGWIDEKWVDISEYQGLYAISSFGRVKSHSRLVYRDRFNDYAKRCERILSQKKHRDGYLSVVLQAEKSRKMFTVHRLVANAFLKKIKRKVQVNHKFGNKKDNVFWNLEWMTAQENSIHAIETGLAPHVRGEGNPKSKLTVPDVLNIKNILSKGDKRGLRGVLAKQYNVGVSAIAKIIYNENWKHVN